MLIHDDCLNGIKTLTTESVDMVYLDPPFFTQKRQVSQDSNGNVYGFSDIWNSRQLYLSFLKEHPLLIISEYCSTRYLEKTILGARSSGHINAGQIQKKDY